MSSKPKSPFRSVPGAASLGRQPPQNKAAVRKGATWQTSSLGCPSRDWAQILVHPFGGEVDVLEQLPLFIRAKPLPEFADHVFVNIGLAQFPQGFDDQSARFAGGGHIFGRCVFQPDFLFSNAHGLGGPVRQEYDSCRDLLRKSQDIRRVSAKRLDANSRFPFERLGDSLRVWA